MPLQELAELLRASSESVEMTPPPTTHPPTLPLATHYVHARVHAYTHAHTHAGNVTKMRPFNISTPTPVQVTGVVMKLLRNVLALCACVCLCASLVRAAVHQLHQREAAGRLQPGGLPGEGRRRALGCGLARFPPLALPCAAMRRDATLRTNARARCPVGRRRWRRTPRRGWRGRWRT